jgi:hypothetical protein
MPVILGLKYHSLSRIDLHNKATSLRVVGAHIISPSPSPPLSLSHLLCPCVQQVHPVALSSSSVYPVYKTGQRRDLHMQEDSKKLPSAIFSCSGGVFA